MIFRQHRYCTILYPCNESTVNERVILPLNSLAPTEFGESKTKKIHLQQSICRNDDDDTARDGFFFRIHCILLRVG